METFACFNPASTEKKETLNLRTTESPPALKDLEHFVLSIICTCKKLIIPPSSEYISKFPNGNSQTK